MESDTNKKANYFNIFDYIISKLDKNQKKDEVIVCLNEDCQNEPFIEITYVDESGNVAGLNNNYANLDTISVYADNYSYIFNIDVGFDDIAFIVYDTLNRELNLVEFEDGEYVGDKFYDDYDEVVFVGYIINKKSDLTYEEKILVLYDVMKDIMLNVKDASEESCFNFKVKDNQLRNIFYSKDWNNGYIENGDEDIEETDIKNLDIIESEFKITINDVTIQKPKIKTLLK